MKRRGTHWILLLTLLWAALCPCAVAQTGLGKHPSDRVLPALFTGTNAALNANALVDGLNLAGSRAITNPAVITATGGTVQTNISYTAVTNAPWVSNNHSGAVVLRNTLTLSNDNVNGVLQFWDANEVTHMTLTPSDGRLRLSGGLGSMEIGLVLVDGSSFPGVVTANLTGNASSASTADTATTANTVSATGNAVRTNDSRAVELSHSLIVTNNDVDPYRGVVISNGIVKVSAYNTYTAGGHTPAVGEAPGFKFYRQDNGTILGGMWIWDDHASAAFTPELIFESPGSMALVQGSGTFNKNIHIGRNGDSANYVNISYGNPGNADGLSDLTSGYGHSQPLALTAVTSGSRYSFAGLMGFNDGTTDAGGGWGDGAIRIYSRLPYWSGGGGGSFATYPGSWQLEVNSKGTVTKGRRVEERTTSGSATLSIDFNGASFVDVTPSVASVTVSLANQSSDTTRVTRKIVRIFSGGLTLSITWPSGWSVLSEDGDDTLPTTLNPTKILRLELESVGSGAGNVVVRFAQGDDVGFTYDADASAFFTASGITDAGQKVAVNNMVLDLKAQGLWTKMHAIYPFVGGSASAHSYNLKNTAQYQITWSSSGVTHDANGITGDGVNGYGNTGYNSSSASTLNDAHVSIYSRTQTPTDGGYFIGNYSDAGANRTFLFRNGASISGGVNGPVTSCSLSASTDFRGYFIASRLSSTTVDIASKGTTTGCAVTSSARPNNTMYVLARNIGSLSGPTTANLAFSSIGTGLTTTEMGNLKTIVDAFQTALGRTAP